MSRIKPFRAYRPRPEHAREIASFPYDVISSDEARALAEGNPLSFLHVGKPEIDLDPSIPLHDDRVYAKAVENLRRLVDTGELVRDDAPCFYVYQQRMGDHVQAGLVGACSVAEYERDLIKKHEYTRKDKEDDRTRHVTECNANAEPVFLTYRARGEIDAIVDRVLARKAGVRLHHRRRHRPHGLGRGRPGGDRRPRATVRLGRRAVRGRRPPPHRRRGPARPAMRGKNPRLRRRAVRVVHGGGLSARPAADPGLQPGGEGPERPRRPPVPGADLGEVRRRRRPPKRARREPAPSACSWKAGGDRLTARPGTYPADDPVHGLDVSILQDNLLAPVLGIADPRTDKRIDFVGGIRGMGELEKRCREGCGGGLLAFTRRRSSS